MMVLRGSESGGPAPRDIHLELDPWIVGRPETRCPAAGTGGRATTVSAA
jgi:hypothetical protein